MTNTVSVLLSRVVALAFGLAWGFFVAFNVVFSDIFGTAEMLGAVTFVVGAYLVLGLGFGIVGHKTGQRFTVWLATPGALFALLMLSDNPARVAYTLGVATGVIGGSVVGVYAGVRGRQWLADRHHRRSGADTTATSAPQG